MRPRFSLARFLRALGVVGGLAVIVVGLGLIVYIAVTAAQATANSFTPPRLSVDKTPTDFGIQNYSEVTFTAPDGVSLQGWYIAPGPGSHTVIVLAHGYAQNRLMLMPEAQLLAGHGYGVLLFDFRGHGRSGDAPVTYGDHERLDLEAALDFAQSQPGVTKLGAIGFSMGAATLAQVAVKDSRLSAAVVEAAFPALQEEISYRSRAFGIISQWPALWAMNHAGIDVAGVNPDDGLCSINPRALLLIYGDQDVDVPPGTVERMRQAICPPESLWVIAGARHQNFMEVVPQAYSDRLLAFFSH